MLHSKLENNFNHFSQIRYKASPDLFQKSAKTNKTAKNA